MSIVRVVTRCDGVASWSREADGHFCLLSVVVKRSNQKSSYFPNEECTGQFFNLDAKGDKIGIAFDQVYQNVTSWCQVGQNWDHV
jgi:hypothetical protein